MGIFSIPAGIGSGSGREDSVRYGDRELFYRVTYSKKRTTLAIVLHRPDGIEVKAPAGYPLSSIRTLVLGKSPWILKKLACFADEASRTVVRNYASGELFYVLGQGITLTIIRETGGSRRGFDDRGCEGDICDRAVPGAAGTRIALCKTSLTVPVPGNLTDQETRDYVKAMVLSWYRETATRILRERVQFFSSVLGIPVPAFRVRNIRRRWGSCSADDHLSFNMRLVMAPKDQIDYVVLHEMCHIFHKDHQAGFWAAVGRYMPDYRERRAALRREGWRYVL